MKILMNMIVMIMLSVNAFGAISPAIRVGNILISPSPMKAVENNGEGNATFNLYESNDVDVPASISGDVNTEITVDLNKAILKDNDISNVTGAMAQYFDIMTINGGKTILFEQKDTIPGDSFGEIRILVEVTENAFAPTTNKVGLLVNISATTGSAGDGSASTYTSLPERPVSPLVLEINSTDVNETTPTTVLTNDNTPEIAGVCTAGDTVTVQIDGEDITPTTVCTEDGTFSITPDEAIDDGEHDVTATQTNPTNNLTSEPSPVDKLIVDTTLPEVAITTVNDANTSTVMTLDTTPEINGTCTGDGTVTVYIDGEMITPTAMCVDGAYSITPDTEIELGDHNVTVTEEDEAGNIATAGPVQLTIKGKPDYTPKIKLVGAVTHGTDVTVPAVLTISELDGGMNGSDVVIRIPKHTYLSFSYDSSMTTLIGKTLNNGDWEIDETRPSEYRFKYVGNGGIFPSNGVSRIGINLTIAPDTANSGEIDFLLDIKPGNGDENQDNDQDASKIGYDN